MLTEHLGLDYQHHTYLAHVVWGYFPALETGMAFPPNQRSGRKSGQEHGSAPLRIFLLLRVIFKYHLTLVKTYPPLSSLLTVNISSTYLEKVRKRKQERKMKPKNLNIFLGQESGLLWT